jgi:hypothetical protein
MDLAALAGLAIQASIVLLVFSLGLRATTRTRITTTNFPEEKLATGAVLL